MDEHENVLDAIWYILPLKKHMKIYSQNRQYHTVLPAPIFNAVNDVKAGKKEGWLKWGAVASCLCLIAAAAYTINMFVSVPENDQYMDVGIEDDSMDGSPNGNNIVQKEQASDIDYTI